MKTLRYLILRRITQVGFLLLFWLAAHTSMDWLQGNYSASLLLDTIPMSDPFAVLQILVAGHLPTAELLLGAGIVLLVYLLLGGRVFCSWICPVNIVADLAGWLRRKLNVGGQYRMPRGLRYGMLVLSLVASAFAGVAAFEWISPIGMTHRELIYGVGLGLWVLAGIFIFDLVLVKNGWCGHVCPLGAAYGLLGKGSLLRVGFREERCDRCMDCKVVCPESQVLNFDEMTRTGLVLSGDCTNCGRCIEICPTDTYSFTHRWNTTKENPKQGDEL